MVDPTSALASLNITGNSAKHALSDLSQGVLLARYFNRVSPRGRQIVAPVTY